METEVVTGESPSMSSIPVETSRSGMPRLSFNPDCINLSLNSCFDMNVLFRQVATA